jgi:GTPase SAR1 family protein
MIGDSGVGKSFLVKTFLAENNDEKPNPTVYVEYGEKVVKLTNNKKVKIELWDTGKYFF